MFQNDGEMFDLEYAGGTRYYNGHLEVASAVSSKKESKVRKRKVASRREDGRKPSAADGKHRFADKLKALLRTGAAAASENGVDADDPYTFSEPEPQVLRLHQTATPVNTYSRRCVARKAGPDAAVPDGRASDDDESSSKTMNRLQAKIARKKVMGKHGRSLLEEQLLGVKQEPGSPPAALVSVPPRRRGGAACSQTAATRHEALQRIRQLQDCQRDLFPLGLEASESEGSDDEDCPVLQRHWFSVWDAGAEGQRGAKLGSVRGELRRRLCQLSAAMAHRPEDQLARALVDAARARPAAVARLLRESRGGRCRLPGATYNRSKLAMLRKRQCCYRQGEKDACTNPALPCTQHCMRHIMYNVDQLLYEHCTAKFSDNTQCCIPVFDICHELPLCLEHARKRDNYDKMCAETKPKRVRKKAKPSAMTRPSKRGKKKRKAQRPSEPPPPSLSMALQEEVSRAATSGFTSDAEESGHFSSIAPVVSVAPSVVVPRDETGPTSLSCPVATPEHLIEKVNHCSNATLYSEINIKEEPYSQISIKEEHIDVSEVEGIVYPLDPDLGHQATNLLEEHDLTNVLNQIPADAFNDLFTEDKNGEYEPTREETEELERALEAVDKDVKSLEKLSQSQGLLDTLIDEQALVQTLAQLPEGVPPLSVSGGVVPVFAAYHNGFVLGPQDAASPPAQLKNFVQRSVDVSPTLSMMTQTDMPS
ncbi:INO80 complex subunit D-like isoform X2 [Bacillus rossius redtenbacheri]|uniref:INO80 complex subunit D-like isoform X2 n=1 Tax=Bacillus rossius redtenbacheri TaxID=93214 RepID=UPI002FDE2541